MIARFTQASFPRRTIAHFVDAALWFGLAALVARLPFQLPGPRPRTGYGQFEDAITLLNTRPKAVVLWLLLVLVVGLFLTLTIRWALGASLGERILNLRLTAHEDRSAGLQRQIAHYFAHIASLAICLIGYAWALLDRDAQSLGNRLSGTRLIYLG